MPEPTIKEIRRELEIFDACESGIPRRSPIYIRFLLARVEALEVEKKAKALALSTVDTQRTRIAELVDWIGTANQFAWAHDSFCPRRITDKPCICGLDAFLSRPRPFVDSYKQRIADLERAVTDLMAWGVEHDNPGTGYITVQVDRAAVEQANAALEKCKANRLEGAGD